MQPEIISNSNSKAGEDEQEREGPTHQPPTREAIIYSLPKQQHTSPQPAPAASTTTLQEVNHASIQNTQFPD
jgi:hypothetical protein